MSLKRSHSPEVLRIQFQPGLNSRWLIHRQHVDRGSANVRQSNKMAASGREMCRPNICARVEESRQSSGIGIDARQVRALVSVAVMASQSEIGNVISAVMLARNDVLNVKT